jgi:dTDP-glucose 4,6-dehydratase
MHPTRDFNYVGDTVDGFIKVAECSESAGETINIGSGIETSIGELADRIPALIEKKVEIIFDATRLRPDKSEVERLVADNSKAKKLTVWEPKISLDEGLKMAIEWISKYLSMYKPEIYNV